MNIQPGELALIPGRTLTERTKKCPRGRLILHDLVVEVQEVRGENFKAKGYKQFLPVRILKPYVLKAV
jgi:hypothetical protein